jgi:peptidoglycan/LPS O-acetylase OafA/YrhL
LAGVINKRVASLDALRGGGALVVVIHHCLDTYATAPAWLNPLAFSLATGSDGPVLVFFALSGFVLFRSLAGQTGTSYARYVVLRALRIYPPLIVAITGSALLYRWVKPVRIDGLSSWFNDASWRIAPSLPNVLGHFALTDRNRFQDLDNVIWSLGQEVRISLLFPLVVLALLVNWRATVALSLGATILGVYVENHMEIPWLYDPFIALRFVSLFAIGGTLARFQGPITQRLSRLHPILQVSLWFIALAGLTVISDRFMGLVTVGAAALTVAISFATPVANPVLAFPALRWLGRVSYSLYLVHLPTMLTFVHLLAHRLPLPLIFGASIVTSLTLAEVFHRVVEKPSARFGKWLCDRLPLAASGALRRLGGRPETASAEQLPAA